MANFEPSKSAFAKRKFTFAGVKYEPGQQLPSTPEVKLRSLFQAGLIDFGDGSDLLERAKARAERRAARDEERRKLEEEKAELAAKEAKLKKRKRRNAEAARASG